MIRERVSTQGVIRPLEPESSLPAFALPHDLVGVISELAVRRYMDGRCKFDKKFKKTVKNIEKVRRRNLEEAKRDVERNISRFRSFMEQGKSDGGKGRGRGREKEKEKEKQVEGEITLNAIPSRKSKSRSKSRTRSQSRTRARASTARGIPTSSSGSWSWAWALDVDERPPPSSIVSRRDTDEAVRLARIADQSVLMEENMITGNNLWSMIVNFLTITPDRHEHSSSGSHHHHQHKKSQHGREHEHEREKTGTSTFSSTYTSTSTSTPVDTHSHDVGKKKDDKDVEVALDGGKLHSKEESSKMEKFRSRFAQFVAEQRKFHFFGDKETTSQQIVRA